MIGFAPQERAYLAPFVVFLAFLLFAEAVRSFGDGYAHWALATPHFWVYPVQTITCGVLLGCYWKSYQLRPFRGFGYATVIGALALLIWISPQLIFKQPARTDGFDPERFGVGWEYWFHLSFRLVRITVIVPLVEELFWRGFLLRYLVREDFEHVPFGTFTWRSFGIVTVAFCFEHARPDWPAALVTSALYNFVAYRTRSLFACVFAHAVTNLLLAFYILSTRQWGFW